MKVHSMLPGLHWKVPWGGGYSDFYFQTVDHTSNCLCSSIKGNFHKATEDQVKDIIRNSNCFNSLDHKCKVFIDSTQLEFTRLKDLENSILWQTVCKLQFIMT